MMVSFRPVPQETEHLLWCYDLVWILLISEKIICPQGVNDLQLELELLLTHMRLAVVCD